MCGIVGKVSFAAADVAEFDIDRMNTAIAHRGPDGKGIYISPDQKVGLGHRRLSIIDVSPAGSQPMRYMDRYEIIFNGEMYNFQEERRDLEKKGYQFNSHTDTEVILALYDQYGQACLDHIRGMFAFAIYDEQEGILFCARDRVGQKPFKYYVDDAGFLFASELKAILTQPEYQKTPDRDAILDFLVLQYTPGTTTGFTGIEKLLPGHSLTVDIKNKKIDIRKYWDIEYNPVFGRTQGEWETMIRHHLLQAVQEQMVADVPVGAMLSGGIDSSVIVALMAQCSTAPIETFSVGFAGERISELPYAKEIATKFKTNHHELHIEPTSSDVLQQLVRTMEEPFGDHGAFPTLLISKLMRQHVTVALNGDGGDENFAGYDRYTAMKLSNMLTPYNSLLRGIANYIPKNSQTDRMHRFIASLSYPAHRRYLEYIRYLAPAVVGNDSVATISNAFESASSYDSLSTLLSVDFHTYLPGALLPKVDMATMAYSLEARSPFFDHRLIEIAATIPSSLKIKGLTNRKYILKAAFKDTIPESIVQRKKRGFSVPLEAWFQDDFFSFAASLLTSPGSRCSEYVSTDVVKQIVSTHKQQGTQGRQLWILLMLELWLREYFG